MERANVKVKKWGNSLGIILPKNLVDKQKLTEGSEIDILITSKEKTKVKDIFGILKGKLTRDTDELMKEVDKDFWGIER